MDELPDTIRDEAELDEVLSRPSPALVEFVGDLDGDVMVLGAGGKMGPTLVRMAQRAVEVAGVRKEIIAVGRRPLEVLGGRAVKPRQRATAGAALPGACPARGVRTLVCDLLDLAAVERLPRARNVVFMAGRKFGSTGDEPTTWAANVIVPYHVARTFTDSRVAVFSTGCVYPLMAVAAGGSTEATPPGPVGEYGMSCLGRERVFDYVSRATGETVVHLRLNYAVEMRYGVLADVATKVWRGEPVDLTTAWANTIWQGDACDWVLRSLALAAGPPKVLNVTGPETVSIRELAETFGRLFERPVAFTGADSGRAYLSDASEANALFGPPRVPLERVIRWTADWIRRGGPSLDKPTHYQVQDGMF